MLSTIQSFFFPSSCLLCGIPNASALCRACNDELPWLTQACLQCGLPLPTAKNQLCGQCQHSRPAFNRTIALFHYNDMVKPLINSFKFQAQLSHGRLLSDLLRQKLSQYYHTNRLPETIIAMPLHYKRLRQRGFNQALELAKPIAKHWKIPLNYHCCQRIRATQQQSELSVQQRKHNVKQAFTVKSHLAGKHIAIIDDVITTGATMQACCLALKRAGVAQIDVWCIARTSVKN